LALGPIEGSTVKAIDEVVETSTLSTIVWSLVYI
jgi:hypothetical protein